MGSLTRGEIVREGLLLAGNDSLTERANFWLNSWLRKQYASWPWPFLYRRASDVPLTVGTRSLVIGNGQGGVGDAVRRILDPVYVYNTDRSRRVTARIRHVPGGISETDRDAGPQQQGIPQSFVILARSGGVWELHPQPVPDSAFMLAFDYLLLPSDIPDGSAGDAQVPLYESDETMFHAVAARALQFMKHPDASGMMNMVATMAVNDRMAFGYVDGVNDVVPLDKGVFR